MRDYHPVPLDTDGVTLPEGLTALTEQIAENVHEIWAAGRIAEGWTFGKKRDDRRKQTPSLVPYAQLPESEKEYDRRTAMNTLKLVMALGYRIEKDPAAPGGADGAEG